MRTDEDLLLSGDAEDFGGFYDRYVDMLLGYFARRAGDADAAADLTAETFAAALVARKRFRAASAPAVAWLFGIAQHKLADHRRRGATRLRLYERLGMERVPLGQEDAEMITLLGRDAAHALIEQLPPDQREAVRAHVIDERSYDDIAASADASESVVRKRVSRGLGVSNFVPDLRAQLVAAAEREQARRVSWRLPEPRFLLAGLAGAAVLAAAIVVLASGSLQTEPAPPQPTDPPAPDGRELFGGSLEPDVRYRTRAFVPALSFAVGDDRWLVPDATSPFQLLLERRQFEQGELRLEGAPSGFMAFSRLVEVYSPEVRGLRASLTEPPADLAGWLRAHPDLRAGPESPVTVAGVPGVTFRVQVRFDRPVHSEPYCRQRFLITCSAISPILSLRDGDRLRFTVLRTEPYPLVISLDAADAQTLAELEDAAAPVLDSLRIGVG